MTDSFPVIIFDDRCRLCNRWVDLIMRADRKRRFRFASLSADFGHEVMSQAAAADRVDSVILLADKSIHIKSDAIIRIAQVLGGVWVFANILRVFPRSWRDAAYDFVARRRYRWFGRNEQCRIPKPDEHDRWID
jgi:predicted DCC family thiol-disulfide oxidoreductase YuxK